MQYDMQIISLYLVLHMYGVTIVWDIGENILF